MTDRERFRDGLERILEDFLEFDRGEFEALFKSMINSKDPYVREKSRYLAYYIEGYLQEQLKKWIEEELAGPEIGKMVQADGDLDTKPFKPENKAAASMFLGKKIKNVDAGAVMLESKDEDGNDILVVKWKNPKKTD